jgi:glutamate synthase (NADPH/NADH) large chain
MGDDTPLAAFSNQQRNFTDFFKQKFAQVTNPPIDPIREKVVMSLNTGFGETQNILADGPQHAKRLKTITPFLSQQKFQLLQEFGTPNNKRYDKHYKLKSYSTVFKEDLKKSLESISLKICDDVQNNGVRVVMLDDRDLNQLNAVMPMLMVVGRLKKELKNRNLGHLVSIVVITGEVFDPHSAACMIGFGASAIYPYLLYYTVEKIETKNNPDVCMKPILKKVRRAMGAGLLKIMSKMGISTISSYRNSKLFDVLGLSKEILEDCFTGAYGLMPGLGYEDIEKRLLTTLKNAHDVDINDDRYFPLEKGGFYKFKKDEEFHDYSKSTITALNKLSISGKKEDYERFKSLVNDRDKKFIRDFYTLKSDKKPINIDDVEPLESIFKRFSTAAMSLGSMSAVSHETLAEAMNTIGAKSNSGEGGEDKKRFNTILNSKIKQVASGRFGVTPAYLRSADELQIKVAQGAKPGEGGQLPGSKVTPLIAELRYTKPGVTLISPPPHHDIYSIEDLAQLIYDLKQINPKAKISVKLVSTAGVGTIAAGVAKAYADKIIISGADGGTGAAPIGSIRFCGNPWELGLIEAHNALKANHLRGQVTLETDGGLKTGLDVVKAAILGAEEFAFGTAALAIVGCIMCRACHLNSCPVGITTQSDRLIAKYKGDVQRVINYFTLLGEDVREILASLGYKTLEEIIGKNDLLEMIDDEFAKKFSFDKLLYKLDGVDTVQVPSNEPFDDNAYEKEILQKVMPTIKDPSKPITISQTICNLNRSFGTLISGEIAELYGDIGLPKDTITFNLTGTVGQSLGAFLSEGININVNGAGNDYIGKGMSGGKIVISAQNSGEKFNLGGNTCLYGATGGTLYINGQVGERFAVRNSGAISVVEGAGDHPCEYMTGGTIVILGKTGINFGAGMTGGVSFVYDKDRDFIDKINQELVEAIRIDTDEMDTERFDLKRLIRDYYEHTQSEKAKQILDKFRVEIRNFWMVRPITERNSVVDTKDKG